MRLGPVSALNVGHQTAIGLKGSYIRDKCCTKFAKHIGRIGHLLKTDHCYL